MTPYYDEDGITIYHGDCREVLPGINGGSIVTDPPYGTGLYESDTDVFTPEVLALIVESFVGAAVFGWPERLVQLCVLASVTPSEWVTWWPTNAAVRGFNPSGLWREAEHIAIFGAGRWSELTRPRTASAARAVTADYQNADTRATHHRNPEARLGDVWIEPSPGLGFNAANRLHPNEKPIGVMQRLVSGMVDGLIVDPFMGSGTTLRAAKDLGRKAIGIEVEESYCEIAVQRLAQGVLSFSD